jgi:exodeoxyribonuclease V alpha subunit
VGVPSCRVLGRADVSVEKISFEKPDLMENGTTLCGVVERITYYNDTNGFVVAKLQEKGRTELTTIVGHLSVPNPGESVRLTGKWVVNKKFGEQFQFDTCEMIVPTTVYGIKKYLGSGMVKGVGPVLAERIVEKFDVDTLEVIERTPKRLSEVEGIGPMRVDMIAKAWEEQKGIKEIMIFLQGHGVSPAYSARIYKHYGNRSIEVVKENPYRLAREMHGIGFITADRIATSIGIRPDSAVRIKAGVLYVLSQFSEEGHVYCPRGELGGRAAELLKVNPELVGRAIEMLLQEKDIFVQPAVGRDAETEAVYGVALFNAERGLAEGLKALKKCPSSIRPIHTEKAIEWVEQKLRIQLADMQKEAVGMAAGSKVLVITGGPGTGKTTIITAILRIFQQLKLRILLAAPTGRAAKRMSEATGREAKTIHRLLEYSPREGLFKKNGDDPLEADVLILDETSMIDTVLMYHLLRAIPAPAHVILVGDVDQLPSVGPGNVLRDVIDSGLFPVVTLTEIFRQARESMIVVNAHRINDGEYPVAEEPNLLSRAIAASSGAARPRGAAAPVGDFYFIEEEVPERILEGIVRLCSDILPRQFGLDPVRDIQVMAPMHRGIIGVAQLNAELQNKLNPQPFGITLGNRLFKAGDKVMQMVNSYDREVFNGDIGRISRIHQEEREITIEFDSRSIVYDFSDADEIALAYATSIHKSQGSEYTAVIFPVSTQHFILLQRNLLYTALTRAKKLAVLIGTRKALGIAIRNNAPRKRYTGLAERLRS